MGGFVALENYKDFVCVNGHAYQDEKSENSNFAFLSKVVLTEPVTDNQAYGESIGKLATLIGGGKPILQRFGDLKRGRRSTWNRIRKGYIEPTMTNVVCGDIAMALPERILSNLIEGLEKLNMMIPGVSNDETLLYAPEIKFFATQIETDRHLETPVRGMYVAGDGPGWPAISFPPAPPGSFRPRPFWRVEACSAIRSLWEVSSPAWSWAVSAMCFFATDGVRPGSIGTSEGRSVR
jgi:uncharacterized FAD-dependent dehydrogenase